MRIALAQINPTVGNLDGNTAIIQSAYEQAQRADADLVIFPELALTGYPPEDLLAHPDFISRQLTCLSHLASITSKTAMLVGYVSTAAPKADVDSEPRSLLNSAALLQNGRHTLTAHKTLLPSYGVFDESRWFAPATSLTVADLGTKCGILICEDMWDSNIDSLALAQKDMGAEIILVLNASPYSTDKFEHRLELARRVTDLTNLPLVYCNLVGGQDEVVFDGRSFALDKDGELILEMPAFTEEVSVIDINLRGSNPTVTQSAPSLEENVYGALTLALHDYVTKNNFPGVILGLSGGVDSALTAAIAVDALGSDKVWGITMPGPYSSRGSVTDAARLAHNLNIRFDELSIKGPYEEYLTALSPVFQDAPFNVAEENLQARTRGNLLMAISNKFGPMVLSTGNKSETAMGYCTLYGDTAGGFAVLRDVPKTLVYKLCDYRNSVSVVIPQDTLTKPPSAELAPDQRDDNTLPPYDILDAFLDAYMEQETSLADLIHIFEGSLTREKLVHLATTIDKNEYKRRQSPPGVKITRRAFGRDRRLPITNAYRP